MSFSSFFFLFLNLFCHFFQKRYFDYRFRKKIFQCLQEEVMQYAGFLILFLIFFSKIKIWLHDMPFFSTKRLRFSLVLNIKVPAIA